jgi:hypothetical protein
MLLWLGLSIRMNMQWSPMAARSCSALLTSRFEFEMIANGPDEYTNSRHQHVDLNYRVVKPNRKAMGDLWHGVLLVLGRQKKMCHIAALLLLYWKDRLWYDILSFACSRRLQD